MRQPIILTILLLSLAACSPQVDKSESNQNDTTENKIPSPPPITTILNAYQIGDSIVGYIKTKIKDSLLTKKTEDQMDPEGGLVYGYYNSNKTIAYLYSSYGGEFGRDETKTYYKDDKIIYAEYRFFWFVQDKTGKEPNEKLVAEKLFYYPGSDIAKDTITIFNDKLKPPYPTMSFKKSSMPTAKDFITKSTKIQANLMKHGK